jgi:hypothetical protein
MTRPWLSLSLASEVLEVSEGQKAGETAAMGKLEAITFRAVAPACRGLSRAACQGKPSRGAASLCARQGR